MQIKPRLLIPIQTIMQISSTHPVTPEVAFDPELPIMPVTFDLNRKYPPPEQRTKLLL